MTSYYHPSQASYSSHGHGHGHHHQPSYGSHQGSVVYAQQPSYAGGYAQPAAYVQSTPGMAYSVPPPVAQVVTVPSSSGHRHGRHRRRHHSGSHGHSHSHSHSNHGHSHSHHRSEHLTLGQRIARFFGIGNRSRHYKYQSNKESWGFLGRGRRRRYYDERTGLEVDRKGRQVIRV